MTTVVLQEPLRIEIEQAAAKEGIVVDKWIESAVKRQLMLSRQKAIIQETEAWYRLPSAERERFRGKYVAVSGGEVVDFDSDRLLLYRRVSERFGRIPFLITEGGDEPIPEYLARTFFDCNHHVQKAIEPSASGRGSLPSLGKM